MKHWFHKPDSESSDHEIENFCDAINVCLGMKQDPQIMKETICLVQEFFVILLNLTEQSNNA